MLKAAILSLCAGPTITCALAEQPPRIDIGNGVSKFETNSVIVYSGGDERCEYQKQSGEYTYKTLGFPPSTKQAYFQRRFEALKQKFEDKN